MRVLIHSMSEIVQQHQISAECDGHKINESCGQSREGRREEDEFQTFSSGCFWVDWNEWHALETNGMLCCAVDHKKKMVEQRKK